MRQFVTRVLAPALLGLSVGCSPLLGYGSGCENPPPRATDAGFSQLYLVSHLSPCDSGLEVPQGSDPHVVVDVNCPGDADPFLVAVKVDGSLVGLNEVRGAGHGQTVQIDVGSWEASDTLWHDVEVVIDPLNLFKESDESNNRGTARVRVVTPDAALDPSGCGFRIPLIDGGDGSFVTQVPPATPVEVVHTMMLGGPYPQGVVRSVRSGSVLEASETMAITGSCVVTRPDRLQMVTRWTPPGPGDYDVEFRIEPLGTTPDYRSTNNFLTRRLTVSAAAPPGTVSMVRRRPRG